MGDHSDASYDTPDDGEAVQVDPSAVQKYISDTISGASTGKSAPAPTSRATSPPGRVATANSAAASEATGTPTVPSSDAGTTASAVPCVN